MLARSSFIAEISTWQSSGRYTFQTFPKLVSLAIKVILPAPTVSTHNLPWVQRLFAVPHYQSSFYNVIPSIYVLKLRALVGDGKPNANPIKVERGRIAASSAEISQMRDRVVTGVY
jgi:hypothetical protein